MCGVAGVFNYGAAGRPVDRPLLERMTQSLAHRGPDGEGYHVEGPIGLGHRRLAIVDLTPTGAQPMSNEDGSAWISYNGEFYDHDRFRAQLRQRHQFRGRSDTETLLHLLEERGAEGLSDVAAIFGLAYWDKRSQTLTLARDALGVKQLYYHDDGERLLFASEIKALLKDQAVRRELDPEAVNQYLHFHTPLFERTFFKGIRQLRPGEFLRITVGGASTRGTFWRLDDFRVAPGGTREQVERVRDELSRVVSSQLMSDVPVGAFFSGGIDSSTVAEHARRSGASPRCFGVYFSGQGVIDERPYAEAAARALGLELELLTLDGSSFPEDFLKLIYHQDEPVIGAAMLPMYHVSKLASRHVKVCLGGQAGDEVFGGYARYALAHPLRAAASMLGRRGTADTETRGERATVGGNLFAQAIDPRVLRRLARNAINFADWRELYFSTFAKVPEASWKSVISPDDLVSRESCRLAFREGLAASPATDPADKVMHWDLQTYLPGLFQQDDRMSMACSLESRVPLADPRLVRLAFSIPPGLKIRRGASKWILRQAVADVLPEFVLNRRKVGFDTPAERWLQTMHSGFLRDTLLSSRARHRGLWNSRALADLIDHPERAHWFDVIWKALCIEVWATIFLDATPQAGGDVVGISMPPPGTDPVEGEPTGLRELAQEVRELGPKGLAFRGSWELMVRSGTLALLETTPDSVLPQAPALGRCLFEPDVELVHAAARARIPAAQLDHLVRTASQAASGQIVCFGRWLGDFGQPVDWHLNPINGRRWDARAHWSRVLRDEGRVGDVKLAWEAGRFPQAYHLARAGLYSPEHRARFDSALAGQIESFLDANPYGRGIHWVSGQEIVIRLVAWVFGATVFGRGSHTMALAPRIARALAEGCRHLERYLEYSKQAVYNNHLLADALGLYLGGTLLEGVPEAARWQRLGLDILTEEADAQVYADGAYIQHSHNYHRAAMQILLWATALRRREGLEVPTAWLGAMERSLDFLFAHLNPVDGRLPNYGANDGAMPSVLTTCDFSDFRPTLQALSLATRGERLFEPGPWDEESAWILGPGALDAPLRPRRARSRSFGRTGYHVLRSDEPGTFTTFRCGSVEDRFSQIDMLALDVWWRGENVLVDAGSYLYNGPERWHRHFLGTASHNTVMVDRHDQMLHYRKFKSVYWTRARLLQFDPDAEISSCAGEHYGFARHPGGCVHRRAVLAAPGGLWVVADSIAGEGSHLVRLHWLGGPYAARATPGGMTLMTPAGPFELAVHDSAGVPVAGDIARGSADPIRGWLSRYYGEMVPVPSFVIEQRSALPCTLVTVLGPAGHCATRSGGVWTVAAEGRTVRFRLDDGLFRDVELT